ncbi:unnamed protein product [Rhizophagus irregularis]|nr:unnamed protein product [Rhizophagus irregularis]
MSQLMKKILGDTNGKDERPKWKRALEAFKRTSAVYKEKHNKSPVIDYDKIAKLRVFVSSGGSVPRRIESWSRAKQPFEVIEQQILTEVKKKFDSAKLLQYQTHHEAEKDVIRALLNSKEIDTDLFRKYFKDESVSEVLEANVFAYHPSRDTVTFQSQSVRYFIQKNSSIFTKENPLNKTAIYIFRKNIKSA